MSCVHDDVIKWKHFPCYWPFVRGIHRWPVDSPHKGQWRWALMFSLMCACTNDWANTPDTCVLRRHVALCDVTVMRQECSVDTNIVRFRYNTPTFSKLSQKTTMMDIICPHHLHIHNSSHSAHVSCIFFTGIHALRSVDIIKLNKTSLSDGACSIFYAWWHLLNRSNIYQFVSNFQSHFNVWTCTLGSVKFCEVSFAPVRFHCYIFTIKSAGFSNYLDVDTSQNLETAEMLRKSVLLNNLHITTTKTDLIGHYENKRVVVGLYNALRPVAPFTNMV